MSFVKVDRFYVNLDHITCVEDCRDTWLVNFSKQGQPFAVHIKKNSEEGVNLIKALESKI